MATLDIDPELHEIARRAKADGAIQAALVEVALRRYLDRVEERSPRLPGEEVLDVPNHARHALPPITPPRHRRRRSGLRKRRRTTRTTGDKIRRLALR
jgi:hypothetical protein